jgi:tetratricopeptide (TPR) repeat protein
MKPRVSCLVLLFSMIAIGAFAQARPEPDLCAVPPGAQPLLPARLMEGMGATNMPVTTGSEEARRFFNQGISQMHSFWFQESERSFLQAAALDPDMAMAYWGIAVSAAGDYRPAFQLLRDPYDGGRTPTRGQGGEGETTARTANGAAISGSVRAREAAAKAMSLRGTVTERERLYIESQWARRNPDVKDQDAAYIEGLRKLVAAYPDDLEAKSILGLATLNGYDPVSKEPRAGTLEAVRLLEEVVGADDNHFGAHHYLIHGYEGGKTPEKAWHACKRYPELVPNIPHALHMPGHIYAQSDKIDEAIAAFADAATNELGYLQADVLYPNGHHGHNVHFLIHVLNLDGRFRDSMTRARHLLAIRETPRERAGGSQRVPYRQGYFSLIKTLTRFERWDLVLDGSTIPAYDKPEQQAWRQWAIGLARAARGEMPQAREALADLEVQRAAARASTGALQIASLELEGVIAVRAGERERGYALLRKAADREAALLYSEPPPYPRPVVESLGSAALAAGDFHVAERAWREALEREPGSGRAFFGLAAALRGLERFDEARTMAERGARAWDKADEDLPELQKARTYAAAKQ